MTRTSLSVGPLVNEADIRRQAHLLVPSAIWRSVAGAFARFAAWNKRRREIARTVEALSKLSDRTLKDIGIERHDIPRIARDGRELMAWIR
jgi:uncharacterized protein YjiS (DUF1127 family)